MEEAGIAAHLSTALVMFLTLALPPLVAALAAGLTVRILQAATQVQDQTLPQTVKLLVVVGVLALMLPVLAGPLVEHAKRIFTEFPALTARP